MGAAESQKIKPSSANDSTRRRSERTKKMNLRLKKNYAFAAAFVLLPACASESDDAPKIIVGTWAQTGSEKRVGSDQWAPAADEDCRIDNVEEYAEDGSWTLYDGTFPCDAGSSSSISHGTWRLAASDTKLVYTYDTVPGEYEATVENLTGSELVLTFNTNDVAGTQVRSTYRKQ